jgi:hypothetical protein
MRHDSDTFVEEIKTHILYSVTFYPKNHVIYEIQWKKVCTAEQATDDKTIWCMRISWWINRATDTNSE